MPSAEILMLRQEDKEIREIAEEAKNSISTHEQLCALRYQAINNSLSQLKLWIRIGVIVLACLMKSERLMEIIRFIKI